MIFWALMLTLALATALAVSWPLLNQKKISYFLAAFVIVSGAAIYGKFGSPNLVSATMINPKPFDDVIEQLQARLKTHPDEAETWSFLGRAHFSSEQYDKSAEAYLKASQLVPSNIDYKSSYAEALVQVAKGTVTAEATKIFEEVLTNNPKEARSRFYQALAREQAGDFSGALPLWAAMLKDAKPDDGWKDEVAKHVLALEKSLGEKSAQLEILQKAPADQMDMIRGMVANLANKMESDPQNSEGWIKLMRAYMVLKEVENAKATLAKALKSFKGDASILTSAARDLGVPQ